MNFTFKYFYIVYFIFSNIVYFYIEISCSYMLKIKKFPGLCPGPRWGALGAPPQTPSATNSGASRPQQFGRFAPHSLPPPAPTTSSPTYSSTIPSSTISSSDTPIPPPLVRPPQHSHLQLLNPHLLNTSSATPVPPPSVPRVTATRIIR